MAGGDYSKTDIHANIVRLRREAEWYRLRLQETCDKIADLEHAAVEQAPEAPSKKVTRDDGPAH